MKSTVVPQEFHSLTRPTRVEFTKLFLVVGLGILLQSCVGIRQTEETSIIPTEPPIAGAPDLARLRSNTPVLMVGDSLTVGDFGEALQAYLLQRFGNTMSLFMRLAVHPLSTGYVQDQSSLRNVAIANKLLRPRYSMTSRMGDGPNML